MDFLHGLNFDLLMISVKLINPFNTFKKKDGKGTKSNLKFIHPV